MSTSLKKRSRFTSTVEKALQKNLQDLSSFTRVPQTRLLDEALEDLIEKYKEKGFIPSEGKEEEAL